MTEEVTMNYSKVEWTYQPTLSEEDSFDFTSGDDGSTADADHKEWIDILSMGGGVSEPGTTAYEYELKDVIVTSYDTHGATAEEDHDGWIDVLSSDWGMHRPGAKASEAGLRSDGELVQAVSDGDMSGDFIL